MPTVPQWARRTFEHIKTYYLQVFKFTKVTHTWFALKKEMVFQFEIRNLFSCCVYDFQENGVHFNKNYLNASDIFIDSDSQLS